VDRHHRQDLVDRPDVGQRLEQAEVAVIDVVDQLIDLLDLLRYVLHVTGKLGNLDQGVLGQVFGQGPLADIDLAVLEQLTSLGAVEQGVVEALLDVLRRHHVVGDHQVFEQIVGRFRQLLRDRRRQERGDVEDVEQQHRVVGDDGPADSGDDRRVGDVVVATAR